MEKTMFQEAQEFLHNISDALYEEWDKLCKEFKINKKKVPFIIDRNNHFMKEYYDLCKYNSPSSNFTQEFIKDFGAITSPNSVMCTLMHTITKDGNVLQFVYFSVEKEIEYALICHLNKELAIDFLKMSLRHEMGHVLHNISFWDASGHDMEKMITMINKVYDDRKAQVDSIEEEYKDVMYDDMYYKKYHNTPCESEANAFVGLTWEDHWKFHKLMEESPEEEIKKYKSNKEK